MMVLWLRYLTEIDEKTREVPQELLANPEIRKAVTQLEESAFTDSQIAAYDKFWDVVRNLRSIYRYASQLAREKIRAEGRMEGLAKGREEGLAEGREEGLAEGLKEGERNKQLQIARNLRQMGLREEDIVKATGLSWNEIAQL